MFSGGRDSFLSACYLIEDGFKVCMATFENGVSLQTHNAAHGARRIVERYGKRKAEFLGVHNMAGIWRQFLLPYFNMKPTEIIKEYGELTISQFNCLTCRSAMYVWSIIAARQRKVDYIAEGARRVQGIIVELPDIITRLRNLVSDYSIKLLLPVYELDSDWEKKNALLLRGFVPKTLESQCLIGVPLPSGKPPDREAQESAARFFDKIILPRARGTIAKNAKIILGGSTEL